jgi:hypothetical protein
MTSPFTTTSNVRFSRIRVGHRLPPSHPFAAGRDLTRNVLRGNYFAFVGCRADDSAWPRSERTAHPRSRSALKFIAGVGLRGRREADGCRDRRRGDQRTRRDPDFVNWHAPFSLRPEAGFVGPVNVARGATDPKIGRGCTRSWLTNPRSPRRGSARLCGCFAWWRPRCWLP